MKGTDIDHISVDAYCENTAVKKNKGENSHITLVFHRRYFILEVSDRPKVFCFLSREHCDAWF